MVMTQPWLLISVMTMRRLGRSVNADIIIINGVMMGDGVVMGNGKFGEVVSCWDVAGGLDWTTVGGDVDRSSLVLLRFCVWLYGVVKVLQLEGVRQGDVVIRMVGPGQGWCPPVLIMAVSR
jgi:hypothetical protein